MNELWAIAKGDRIVVGTNANSSDDAWNVWIERSNRFETRRVFILAQKKLGYSAVRLRYWIVEREGEVR